MSMTEPVLVMGCSSGIGHATALELLDRGYRVYATARNPESIADLAQRGCGTLALDADRPRTRYRITPSAKVGLAQHAVVSDRLWDRAMRGLCPPPPTA